MDFIVPEGNDEEVYLQLGKRYKGFHETAHSAQERCWKAGITLFVRVGDYPNKQEYRITLREKPPFPMLAATFTILSAAKDCRRKREEEEVSKRKYFFQREKRYAGKGWFCGER